MKRPLQIAVRRGGKFKRTKKFLKVLGLTAAALALSRSPVAQNFHRKLQNKVDKAVKRKIKEYGRSLGEGMREGANTDELAFQANTIAQGNLQRFESILYNTLDKGKGDVDEILKNVNNNGISRIAGWIAGGENEEVVERTDEEAKDFVESQSWWPF